MRTLRATSLDAKLEWREALRRILRARSFAALNSDFDYSEDTSLGDAAQRRAFRCMSYAEDLVLVVRNNHIEESVTVDKKRKATVSQAKKLAQAADNLAMGRKPDDVTLVTQSQVVVQRKQKIESERLMTRVRKLAIGLGLLREPDRPPALVVTTEVTIAMNQIGLKTNRFFEGVWMFKRNKGERLYRKRFAWIDPNGHAFLWAKVPDRRVGKPMILFPTVQAEVNGKDSPLSWTIRGGGYDLELQVMQQVVQGMESEIFSPQLWVDAIRLLRKADFK